MHHLENGDMLFSAAEVASLAKVITSVHTLLAALPTSSGELLGDEDHYRALCMWEDVLNGRQSELSWYSDEDEEEEDEEDGEEEEESEDLGEQSPQTVAQWLAAYGTEDE